MKNKSDEKIIKLKIKNLLREASQKNNMDFPEIEIKFDLKGVCAGIFYIKNYQAEKFNFNMELFNLNREEFDQTIIHEVAHYITKKKFGFKNNIKPHGKEWKFIMRQFGATPKRCHNLKMPESTKKTTKKWEYKCDCDTKHFISNLIHKRIGFGTRYFCNSCKGLLKKV